MKKLKFFLISLTVLALLVVGVGTLTAAPSESNPAPTLVIGDSNVLKLHKSSQVYVMGSGYEPGMEIRIVISQKDGTRSDVGSALASDGIVANDDGVWGTTFTAGRYMRIAKADMYVMMACDSNYNVLATAPFGYYSTKDAYAEWPAWAQAVIAEPEE